MCVCTRMSGCGPGLAHMASGLGAPSLLSAAGRHGDVGVFILNLKAQEPGV